MESKNKATINHTITHNREQSSVAKQEKKKTQEKPLNCIENQWKIKSEMDYEDMVIGEERNVSEISSQKLIV